MFVNSSMMIKDIGKFLGGYFFIIGCIQIIIMLVNQKITGDINIQLSFLLNFIVGYYLYNHNMKARKILVVILGLLMLVQFSIFIYFSINGIPDGAQIRLLGVNISNILSAEYIPILFAMLFKENTSILNPNPINLNPLYS